MTDKSRGLARLWELRADCGEERAEAKMEAESCKRRRGATSIIYMAFTRGPCEVFIKSLSDTQLARGWDSWLRLQGPARKSPLRGAQVLPAEERKLPQVRQETRSDEHWNPQRALREPLDPALSHVGTLSRRLDMVLFPQKFSSDTEKL